MDTPPVDHGSDRYDYVEVQGAPPGVAPHGAWWDRLLASGCPDCRPNIFAKYIPPNPNRPGGPDADLMPWSITIAHDATCPGMPT